MFLKVYIEKYTERNKVMMFNKLLVTVSYLNFNTV